METLIRIEYTIDLGYAFPNQDHYSKIEGKGRRSFQERCLV